MRSLWRKFHDAIGSEAFLTVFARVVILVAGLATSIVTARLLGPDGRGLYFYALTVAAFVTQFGSLGFSSSNTYFVTREPAYLKPLAANSAWLSMAVFVLAGLAVTFLSGPDDAPGLLMLLAVLLGSSSLFFMLFSNLLVGMQRLVAFNLLQIGSNLAVLPAMIVAAWLNGSPQSLLIGSIVASLAFCVVAVFVLTKRDGFNFRPRPDIFRLSLSYSFRAFLITLIGYAVARGNVFILRSVSGDAETGFYSIAVQICDALAILPISISLVIFPRLIRAQEGRYREMLRMARLVAVLGFAGCLVAALLAGPFVHFAFGPAFAPSVAVVYAMLPGSLCLGTATIVSQYMAASGMPWRTFLPWLAAGAALAGAAWYLIPLYQAAGAAAAMSASYAVLLVLMVVVAISQDRKDRLSGPRRDQPIQTGVSR
jgi:O-antigen/teichoic acid export membrane protein